MPVAAIAPDLSRTIRACGTFSATRSVGGTGSKLAAGRQTANGGRPRQAAGDAHLKVILETGELETYDNVRRASVLAIAAGADFIKTSTGKVTPAATLPVTLVMLEQAHQTLASALRAARDEPGALAAAHEARRLASAKQDQSALHKIDAFLNG